MEFGRYGFPRSAFSSVICAEIKLALCDVLCLLIASVRVLIASDLLHWVFGIPNLCCIFAGAIRGTLASPIA